MSSSSLSSRQSRGSGGNVAVVGALAKARQQGLPLHTGSTMSIPLLRSFLGEAPPTPRVEVTDLTRRTRCVHFCFLNSVREVRFNFKEVCFLIQLNFFCMSRAAIQETAKLVFEAERQTHKSAADVSCEQQQKFASPKSYENKTVCCFRMYFKKQRRQVLQL